VISTVATFSTRKPSLEVAPTTLATFSSCSRELRTLAFELDLDNVKINPHASKVTGHFIQKLLSRGHTDTHTGPIALPGPLNGQ